MEENASGTATGVNGSTVKLDWQTLDAEMLRRGKSHRGFADELDISWHTLNRVRQNLGIRRDVAEIIARGIGRDLLSLLLPEHPHRQPPPLPVGSRGGESEWDFVEYLDGGTLHPNFMQSTTCRMRHRHHASRLGRGKVYHIPDGVVGEGMAAKLSRHAETCTRLQPHCRLAVNLVSAPSPRGEAWWVIDHWIGTETLASSLVEQAWPTERLPKLLREIAEGLEAMHRAEIVFRALAPERILIAERDGEAVLTDFELAKLFDGSPTVADSLRSNAWMAPEVEGGEVSAQTDYYSLARVCAKAIAGPEYDANQCRDVLRHSQLPKKVAEFFLECLDSAQTRRPSTLAPLLDALRRWEKRER